jgi:hypothetical protein
MLVAAATRLKAASPEGEFLALTANGTPPRALVKGGRSVRQSTAAGSLHPRKAPPLPKPDRRDPPSGLEHRPPCEGLSIVSSCREGWVKAESRQAHQRTAAAAAPKTGLYGAWPPAKGPGHAPAYVPSPYRAGSRVPAPTCWATGPARSIPQALGRWFSGVRLPFLSPKALRPRVGLPAPRLARPPETHALAQMDGSRYR